MKIAIIGNAPHNFQGGVAVYNNQLIKLFMKHGHDVSEFVFDDEDTYGPSAKGRILRERIIEHTLLPPYNSLNQLPLMKRLNRIVDEFDLVIVCGQKAISKKMVRSNKVLIVQHEDSSSYDKQFSKFQKFPLIMFNKARKLIFSKGNRLALAKNVVFFSKETSIKNPNNISYIPLSFEKPNCEIKRRGGSFWLGRISYTAAKDKNLKMLSRNWNDMNTTIFGPESKVIDKLCLRGAYGGFLTDANKIREMAQFKVMVLPSKKEGFSFATIEAMSLGIPVVSYNSWDGTKFFEKSKAFFAVEYGDEEKFVSEVKRINEMPENEYAKISKDAINFFERYLSVESFEKSWVKLINHWGKGCNNGQKEIS